MSGATDRVRQELGGASIDGDDVAVELGGLLRAGGSLARRDDAWSIELLTPSGAVARRAHQLLRALAVTPTILVREATNVARRTYGVRLVETPAAGAYDAIILAVAHRQFVELGADAIHAYGKPACVVYDVKSILPRSRVDGRL